MCSVRVLVLLARYLTNQWTEFHQTLVDGVFEGKDELIRFWGIKKQILHENSVYFG